MPRPIATADSSAFVVWLFSATLFLGAFLLFTVELIVAKAVLPAFGGVPMVWNTCMAFFQAALLMGYLYGHGAISWIGTRRHSIAYALLVAAPLFLLPFPTQVSSPVSLTANPIGRLLTLLVGWIGLPFFVLATSAAVLQKGFSTINATRSSDPYFLYAASNFGSLLALVSYPTFVERLLPLHQQSRIWTVCYAAYVVGVWGCAAVTLRSGACTGKDTCRNVDAPPTTLQAGRIGRWRRARWVALAFVPSSLMLAVTTYLSTDIAAVPLLWTVPLSLYLLTFVLAFGSPFRSVTALADRALPLFAIPLTLFMVVALRTALWMAIPAHLLAFTAAALLCHGRLADDRPPPESLTEFYLWIALGGMLGGLFNTLAAPVLFNTVVEYPVVLVLACLLRVGTPEPRIWPRSMDAAVPIAIAVLTGAILLGMRTLDMAGLTFLALSVPAFLAFSQSRRHPFRFALCLAAMLVTGAMVRQAADGPLLTERTFYGVYRVSPEYSGQYRALVNGTTLHGMQAVDPGRRREPLTYYHRSGPFGDAASAVPAMAEAVDVAAVGLGIGSLAAYARPEQRWTFFELDPAVERLARTETYFTYLQDCGERCRVVLGDARISLSREPPAKYGVIVLDAFSSDAIPIHLLTDEAFGLYLSRLADGGVLLAHVSNRHLELSPILARLIAHHGLTARERVEGQVSQDEQRRLGKTASQWVVVARRESDLGALVMNPTWTVPVVSTSAPLWTDDSSSILSVLRLR